MSKLDDAVKALRDSMESTTPMEGDYTVMTKAVLTSIRDPRDIPPSQLGAWQANIDRILKDAK